MKKRLFSEFCLGLVFFVLLLSACMPGGDLDDATATWVAEVKSAEANETASAPIQSGSNFLSDKSNPLIGKIHFGLPQGSVAESGWGDLHSQIIAEYTGDVVSLFRVNDGNTVKAMVLDFSEDGWLTVLTPNGGLLRVVYAEGEVWEGSLGGPSFFVRFTNGEIQFH